jgi:3-deoxy-D-arabino-heptulosonate 7-phosphate (DAHP) synthase
MARVEHRRLLAERHDDWRDRHRHHGRSVRCGGEAILEIAHQVREMGATVLRAGAFKPRSSPYSFQGLGLQGLELLARAREETGLAIVTEALDPDGADLVA